MVPDESLQRAQLALDAALRNVSQRLRQLQGLSLTVLATQACGPAARHTACFPPQPHPLLLGDDGVAAAAPGVLPRCVDPCTMLVRLPASLRPPHQSARTGETVPCGRSLASRLRLLAPRRGTFASRPHDADLVLTFCRRVSLSLLQKGESRQRRDVLRCLI